MLLLPHICCLQITEFWDNVFEKYKLKFCRNLFCKNYLRILNSIYILYNKKQLKKMLYNEYVRTAFEIQKYLMCFSKLINSLLY